MTRDYDYSALASQAEAIQCSEIMAQSFLANPEEELSYLHQVGFDQVRVVRQGNQILGGLGLLPMGLWFGGKRVAMTGVASLAIAPHARGRGVATRLMTSLVQELASQGVALSVLYPAVQTLYQKVGYGPGGSRYTWRIPTDRILVNSPPLPCYPLTLEAIDPHWLTLQQRLGQISSGRLERHPMLWQRLLKPPGDGQVLAYQVGTGDLPQGYFIGYQERGADGALFTIRDWAATSLEAMQSIWGLLYQQRAQVDWVQWAGGAVDPLALALPEQQVQGREQSQWLLRILDLHQAMTQRGYSLALDGDVHFDITDKQIPANNGRFVLTVQGGQGQLAQGGRGDLAIDIAHLPALFTGLRTAQELEAMGLIQGSAAVLPLATALFSGPAPWMPDFF